MEINYIIEEMINQEVEARVANYTSKYEQLKEQHKKVLSELQQEKNRNKDLKTGANQFELLSSLSDNIDAENIEEIVIANLGYKYENISFGGMNSEHIPQWFKIICKYFDNKEDILNIFDLFKIEYPHWAKDIVLPSHYDKDDLEFCLSRINKLYVTNGQIYEGNMGFYYAQFSGRKFNLKDVFNKNSYVSIPYQLLLKNKLLVEDDTLFEMILNSLYEDRSHASYFMKIVEYQNLDIEKVKKLLKPNRHGSITYKSVLSKYPQLLKDYKIGSKFKDHISEYSGSELFVLKFSKDIQKEYFLKRNSERDKYSTFDFVKLIDQSDELSVDEKAELIKQCYLNMD